MERRFDMSDFEQSLKDHADQFKMTPSKRVWNGIYNNLHPGSKWPSITVATVFIITLVTIGTLNNTPTRSDHSTNVQSQPAKNISKSGNEAHAGEAFAEKDNSRTNSAIFDLKKTDSKKSTGIKSKSTTISVETSQQTSVSKSVVSSQKNTSPQKLQSFISSNNISLKGNEIEANQIAPAITSAVNEQISANFILDKKVNGVSEMQILSEMQLPVASQFEAFETNFLVSELDKTLAFQTISIRSLEGSSGDFINPVIANENAILSAQAKFHRKKNLNIEWTFYVNPTISTVAFNKKDIHPSSSTSSLVVLSTQPPFKLTHTTRFGLETGAEMSVKLNKKFKFITGLNLSYAGYNNVSNLVHPTFATLSLLDKNGADYSKTYITHYGNGQSQDHINLVNYSIEASIPVGIQYNIWANAKTRFDISSLLEPSVVLRDDAYLISSDGRYYVNDPMMVRRTNLEGHFGSYITLIGKKIRWHLGPDFRYQLLSTYKNIYPGKEHLLDYGIRIGISKQK